VEPLSLQVGERNNRRRSQRVLLNVAVGLSGETPDKTAFSEQTNTLVVNAHGALLVVKTRLSVGQLLKLQNFKTQEEVACRVVFFNHNSSGKAEAGVEFLKPSPGFWRIAFPPSDWTPKSAEAKTYTAKPGAKAGEKLAPAARK